MCTQSVCFRKGVGWTPERQDWLIREKVATWLVPKAENPFPTTISFVELGMEGSDLLPRSVRLWSIYDN